MFSIRTKLVTGVAAAAVTMAVPALAEAQEQAKAVSDSTKPDSSKKEVFQISPPAAPTGSQGQGMQIQGLGGQGMVIQMAPAGGGKGMQGTVQIRMQGTAPTLKAEPDTAAAKADSTKKP